MLGLQTVTVVNGINVPAMVAKGSLARESGRVLAELQAFCPSNESG